MKRSLTLLIALGSAVLCASMSAQDVERQKPGPLPDGGYLLNNGWRLRPAGDLVPVDTLPVSSARSSDGRYLLVLNTGIHPPSVSVIDGATKKEAQRMQLPDAWLGLTRAASSDLFYVGGGSSGKVYELSLSPEGKLSQTREFVVNTRKLPGAPFIGAVALSPDSRVLYAADLYGDSVAQINLQSGKMVDHWKTGRRPYGIVVTPDGAHLLISSWSENTVYEHESGTGILTTKLRVGSHPGDMLWVNKPFSPEPNGTNYVARLFVAASGSNSVYSFGITQDGQFSALDSINVSMTSVQPLGMTPSALAIDDAGTTLYITCSGANALAVADISRAPSGLLGFIPTSRYPTSIRLLTENRVAVINGKNAEAGESSGSVEYLPLLTPANGAALTRQALENSPYRDNQIYGRVADPDEAFFAGAKEHPSPIQHVIYVIAGNESYTRFVDATPNLHKLAQEFRSYENFYCNGDNEAEGQSWAVAAIAPDYTVKLSPAAASGRSQISDFEGGELANTPPAGYLWSNALQAGLTVRNYGEWVKNIPVAQPPGQTQVQIVTDPSLNGITNLNFRGADLSYKDSDRVAEFVHEWKAFDAKGQAPQLSIVRVSNNTARDGQSAPLPGIADNDRAIGLLVDTVSHSKLWRSTAIFVVNAASEPGSNSAAPALVVSPYTRHGNINSEMFSQVSVLRTVEIILGLRPMTQFDAAAQHMFGTFNQRADTTPFTSVMPKS